MVSRRVVIPSALGGFVLIVFALLLLAQSEKEKQLGNQLQELQETQNAILLQVQSLLDTNSDTKAQVLPNLLKRHNTALSAAAIAAKVAKAASHLQQQQEEKENTEKQGKSNSQSEPIIIISSKDDEKAAAATADEPIPVLVIACNRPAIVRCVDRLLQLRPSDRFPIIISQDCGDAATAAAIRDHYSNKVIHLMQPDLSNSFGPEPAPSHFLGYYKISRHYKWALTQVFDVLFYNSVIIVEDDLEISEDFFEYFAAGRKLLAQDSTLWCVSAWNDNGKQEFVSSTKKLYRSDFFPGLGWMLTRSTWLELGPKWPKAFWDDWMREPEQRQGRACIRPDISRVTNFGEHGVSGGQFFSSHIARIIKSEEMVRFTQMDLSYLLKGNYDYPYTQAVSKARLVRSVSDLNAEKGDVRIEYGSNGHFEQIASQMGLMSDLKAGVPRTAYLGIVEVMYNGNRVYISPPPNWSGYVKS